MTATPRNEIDKNTYGVFDLERGVPTFAYELDQAVKEGYLVDYSTLEYKTKIMEDGIHIMNCRRKRKTSLTISLKKRKVLTKTFLRQL